MLPTFARASLLDGAPPATGINIQGTELIRFGAGDVSELVARAGASGIRATSQPEIEEFGQMLAKIAYSYVVAAMGLFPRDETPLLKLMSNPEHSGRWVGCSEYRLVVEDEGPQHAIGIVPIQRTDGITGYFARVKLFANAGATGYEIAVRVPGWQEYANS